MKKLFCLFAAALLALSVSACTPDTPPDGTDSPDGSQNEEVVENPEKPGTENETDTENMNIYFTVGETRLTAVLAENSATAALKEKLKEAPLTIHMTDYGGWEKVGGFGFNLPASNEYITANPCDFVLYQGNQLVIFYGTNDWSYTRLGKFTGITPAYLKSVLGDGDVTVTLSLD